MPEEVEVRLESLEKDIRQLKDTAAVEQTPVFGVALFVGFVLYVILIAKVPLPGNPGFGPRVGIGLVSGFLGGFAYIGALKFVEFSLKAIVEVAAAILLFANAAVGVLLYPFFDAIRQQLSERVGIVNTEPIFAIILGAILLFLINCLALLALYPLARIAGTKLE